jgi:hypothetical protein
LSLRNDFQKNGFVLVPGVLSAKEVQHLREILDKEYEKTPEKHLLAAPNLLPIPEIVDVVSNAKILKAISEAFNHDFVVMPTIQVLRNMFARPKVAWHCDAGSEMRNDYIYANGYCQVKCGVYLQDNTVEWGGGIDVVPGGHRFPLRTGFRKFDRHLKYRLNRLGQKYSSYMVPIKAGDCVFFHSLLPHRSTYPTMFENQVRDENSKNYIVNVPEQRRKYSVYWDFASPVAAKGYLQHQVRLANHEVPGYGKNSAAEDYLSLRYPTDFPDVMVERLKGHNTFVMTPG